MDFSLIDRQDFRIRTITRDGTAEEVALIDYEVQLIFDGIRLTYRLIVPELGQWWNWDGKTESQHDVQWGKNPYHAEATIENVAAAYDVSGYRVTGKASSLRANGTSLALSQQDRAPRQQASTQSPSTQLLKQRLTTADSPNSVVSTSHTFSQTRTPNTRRRGRPCWNCLRSKQKLVCEVSLKERRCTRCVKLHLACRP